MAAAWRAAAVGALVGRRPWRGTVASVHAEAVNILRDDGLLVSLLADRQAMTDLGALVPALAAATDLAGRSVFGGATEIAFEGGAAVDLRGAARWSGALRRGGSELPDLAAPLGRHGRPGGLLGLLNPERATPWSEAARRSLASSPADLAALVGLGPGMTPSGDDFIAGALFAGSLGRLGRGRLGEGAWLTRRAVAAALHRSTAAGRTLLSLALRGRFPAFLLELAAARGGGSVEEVIRSICGRGETSGTDVLVGCWWASRAIESCRRARRR